MIKAVAKLGTLFILLFILLLCEEAEAQNKIEYSKVTSSSEKMFDLTAEAREKCNQTVKRLVGENYVQVKYQTGFLNEAEKIAAMLEKSLRKTQEILSPLPIENIKFYFLQRNEIPKNLKIIDEIKDDKFFLFIKVFKDEKQINFTCKDENELCGDIYATIPHELTHGAVGNLIEHKNLRWFNEGLAEYVATEVRRESRVQKSYEEKISVISLSRPEISQSLWFWKYTLLESFYKNEERTKNEYFRYKASQHLLRLIVEESEKKNVTFPIQIILNELIKLKRITKNPATSEELLEIIRQKLNVNPKDLGALNEKTQKQFVEEALKILAQSEISRGEKYFALYVLACIDQVLLTKEWLSFLLEEIYKDEKKDFLQNLAATVLARRIKQKEFREAVNLFQQKKLEFKSKTLKNIEKDLQNLSIRPPVR